MTPIKMHPCELAYAFSYAEVSEIIGWGQAPFMPDAQKGDDAKNWYADGAARLTAANRLVETENGLNFTEDLAADILALVDPAIVLIAERKHGKGLRRFTVHMANDTLIGMTLDSDGLFELTGYADLTAATAACVGFLGAARRPVHAGTRVETSEAALADVHSLARNGQLEDAIAALHRLGATLNDARSIVQAMAAPRASGMLSLLYCTENVARTARPFSVMTNTDCETWILFPPASLEGPMIVERSSVPALTARVLVNVAAWSELTG